VAVAFVAAGCSGGEPPATRAVATPSAEVASPTVDEPSPSLTRETQGSWRKARYIPVADAMRRVERLLGSPVHLPRDRFAGVRNFRGWLADPKNLERGRFAGEPAVDLYLHKKKQILIISFGGASFDGCGGRDHAIETNVLGQPALLSVAADHRWSSLIWPVTEKGAHGRYGLTGTFEGWQMIELAESMELQRLAARNGKPGC
jgi:hypothetical protein